VWGNCSGVAKACYSFDSEDSCGLQDGCSWKNTYPNGYSCMGTPEECFDFSTLQDCTSQNGCNWKDNCYPSLEYCEEITNQDQCIQDGCIWGSDTKSNPSKMGIFLVQIIVASLILLLMCCLIYKRYNYGGPGQHATLLSVVQGEPNTNVSDEEHEDKEDVDTFKEDFRHLLNTTELSNTVIAVSGGDKIAIHKAILSARAPRLLTMPEGLRILHKDAAEILLQFIYYDKLPHSSQISVVQVVELLILLQRLQLEET